MKKTIVLILLLSFILMGCPSPQQAQREQKAPPAKKPPTPEMFIKLASLNLAQYTKKIERGDIAQFSAQVKRDSIDILTMQGITRYPDITTRVDVVNELASRAGMRQAFGETIALSGRQGGNAVFSTLPIRSNENTHYNGLHSNNFEAALQAIIDCGSRDVVIVSTQLPDRASLEDQSTVANTLGSFNTFYINHPIIISGNLPKSEALRAMASFDEAKPVRNDDAPRLWFSKNGLLKLISTKTESTVFGEMVVVQIGLFRQTQP